MNDLPNEVVDIIVNMLDLTSLFNFCLVDKLRYAQVKQKIKPIVTITFDFVKGKEWKDNQGNKRIIRWKNNIKWFERWYDKDDKLNRNNGPADKQWYENINVKLIPMYEAWYLNGVKHRLNGPAYSEWYVYGNKQYEEWCINDNKHRENGPAVQRWYKNEQKTYEAYYKNGLVCNGSKYWNKNGERMT